MATSDLCAFLQALYRQAAAAQGYIPWCRVQVSRTTKNAVQEVSIVAQGVPARPWLPASASSRQCSSQVFPSVAANDSIGTVTRRPRERQRIRRFACQEPRSSSQLHQPRSGHETDTGRAEDGHRCPVSGCLGATCRKRQRGEPETRQSGGQSVPVGAGPRCRCQRGAGRQSPTAGQDKYRPHGNRRMRLLQARGIPTCRS